jgi:hypothetical protein
MDAETQAMSLLMLVMSASMAKVASTTDQDLDLNNLVEHLAV